MSQPGRSSVRWTCFLAAVKLTIAGSLKDDDVEVVTLGALQPPLVSQVRPSRSGNAGAPPVDREESPDQTIARLLRHMFERESQQLLQAEAEALEDLDTEVPPASASDPPAGAGAGAATAGAVSAAEVQRRTRTDGSHVFLEEEKETRVPGKFSADAAEVGQKRRNQQQQQQQQQEEEDDKGGLGTSSFSGVDLPPHEVDGIDSDSGNDGGRVEAGAVGVANDAGALVDVEGSGEETSSVGASTTAAAAAGGAGDAPARDALLEHPEGSFVEAKFRRARRTETPDDHGAVAAGSALIEETSVGQGQSSDGDTGLEAAVSVVGEVEGVTGPGASAEQEEDGGVAQEGGGGAAGDGVGTGALVTGTDAGEEMLERGSGDDRDTAAVAHVLGLDTEAGERAAVKGGLEGGADSNPSHGTSPAVIPGVEGRVAGVEEGEETADTESTATAKHGGAAAIEAESPAEGASVEVPGVGVEVVAGGVDSGEEVQALLSDVVDEEEMDGAAGRGSFFGEEPSLGIDGSESAWAHKENDVLAAGKFPAIVVTAESSGYEEEDSAKPGGGASVLESPVDSETARDDAGPPPRDGNGDDVAAAAGAEEGGEVGLGRQQWATNSAASSEPPASEGGEPDGRPAMKERRAGSAGDATNDDGVAESPAASNRPRPLLRPNVLSGAPQAESEEAPPGAGAEREANGGGDDIPRPRPVFRFPEPPPSGPGVDPGLAEKLTADAMRGGENGDEAFGFPSLPPIDALPGTDEKKDGGDAAGGGGGGGGWANWGGELGTAARKMMARWASGAAVRGGVLAHKLKEECVARATKIWHENLEPQTEHARRRLEGVADFCVGEVADHLADPVLAEAL